MKRIIATIGLLCVGLSGAGHETNAQVTINIFNLNDVLRAKPIDETRFTVQYQTTSMPDTLQPDKKEEETLMSLTMDLDSTPQSIFYMFNNADIRFESITDRQGNEIGISHGRFVPLLESSDRDLRRKVFQSYYRSFDQYKNTVAAIFSANLKKNCSIQKPDIMPPPWKPICLRTIFRQLFMTS